MSDKTREEFEAWWKEQFSTDSKALAWAAHQNQQAVIDALRVGIAQLRAALSNEEKKS